MRYSDLVEFRTIGPETQSLVESGRRHLRIEVHLVESALGGEIQEAMHYGDASSQPTVLRQYCDTANLTGGFQASCANRVTFCGSRGFENENVRDDGVELVPFVAFRDLLFFDENRPPHALNLQAVVLPGGESHDVIPGGLCRHVGERWQRYVKRRR